MDKKTTVTNLIRDLARQFIPLKITTITQSNSEHQEANTLS